VFVNKSGIKVGMYFIFPNFGTIIFKIFFLKPFAVKGFRGLYDAP
jgi:hypothetical protein